MNTLKSKQNTLGCLARIIPLIVFILNLTGCTKTTKFKENPDEHRLGKTIKEWPNEYYWLVETGISSRILGILTTSGDVQEQMAFVKDIKNHLQGTRNFDDTDRLITHFRENNIEPVADAIEKTLSANAGREPSGEDHGKLQVKAVTQGLTKAMDQLEQSGEEK